MLSLLLENNSALLQATGRSLSILNRQSMNQHYHLDFTEHNCVFTGQHQSHCRRARSVKTGFITVRLLVKNTPSLGCMLMTEPRGTQRHIRPLFSHPTLYLHLILRFTHFNLWPVKCLSLVYIGTCQHTNRV